MRTIIAVFRVNTDDPRIAATLVSFAIKQAGLEVPWWDDRIIREPDVFMEPYYPPMTRTFTSGDK